MSGELLRTLVRERVDEAIELAEAHGTPLSGWRVLLLEGLERCGDPHHGFVWWRCDPCGRDRVVAMSCQQRLVCPRCGPRRMAQMAAHLVDPVLPQVPYRQWVVAPPHPLHQLLSWRSALLQRVGWASFAAVQRPLLHRAGVDERAAGGLVFVQSFTQSVGGVFFGDRGHPSFFVVPPPTGADLEDVAGDIALLLQRMWTRLPEARMSLDLAPVPPGRGVGPTPRRARGAAVCVGGANLHAAARVHREDRRGLEAPRTLRRAPRMVDGIEGEDVHLYGWDGQRLRTLTGAEFLLRLAAVAMLPGVPLLRYQGALAPNSPWRRGVVSGPGSGAGDLGCRGRS